MTTSTEPLSTPTPTRQQLNDAIAESNHLVSRLEYPHTARYHEAHMILHQVYADLRKIKKPGYYFRFVANEKRNLLERAEMCRERMNIERESVRETRKALSEVTDRVSG